MNILAIDQGTSATKALVAAEGGQVLGEASSPVHPEAGAGGAVEHDPDSQPQIVDCDAVVGETDAFGEMLPVTGLAVDQQAALFAESCFEAGEAKCTYGTGAFILATAGEQVARSESRLAACVAWRLGGSTTYCLDGQVYTAGSVVSWLQELDLISEPAD